MQNVSIGVNGDFPAQAREMVYRLEQLGFKSRIIEVPERRNVDVVVFVSRGDHPDGLNHLSAFSYGYSVYGGVVATPVVLVRYGDRPDFCVRGSLAATCSDTELLQAIQETYDMVPHGDAVVPEEEPVQ